MQEKYRDAIPWLVGGVFAVGLLQQGNWFGLFDHTSGPARDVALAGGGTSDGAECGAKGYHYFALGSVTDTGGARPDDPGGPQAVLGSYGGGTSATAAAGRDFSLRVTLLLAAGPSGSLDLAAPLGARGVAVEVEGPDGLVAGAHGLPVTIEDAPKTADGRVHVGAAGLSVEVLLPAEAICPGQDVLTIARKLFAPVDARNTITGQPPYTLAVSLSDPAVAALRHGTGVDGPVLAANNLMPADVVSRAQT